VLAPGGRYVVQDRVAEDVTQPPSSSRQVRGWFAVVHPRPLDVELARWTVWTATRPTTEPTPQPPPARLTRPPGSQPGHGQRAATRSVSASTCSQASWQASAHSPNARSKNECGAPS
jgi:hypothetical protein